MPSTRSTPVPVKDFQRALGLRETGKRSPTLTHALAAYQLAAGLEVTGEPDEATWKALTR